MVWYYLISLLTIAITFGVFVVFRNKSDKFKDILAKIVTGILILVFFARFIGGEFVISDTTGLNIKSPFGALGSAKACASVIILWFTFAAEIATITYPYFKRHVKSLTPIVKYFALAMYVISFATMSIVNVAMDGVMDKIHWRSVVYAVEIGIAIGYLLTVLLKNVKQLESPKLLLRALFVLLGMIVASIPSYAIQVLFGQGSTEILLDSFTIEHRLALYLGILLPVGIHFIFHKYEYEQRRYALLFIALATMISYSYKHSYVDFIDISAWPLHLCNTAMFVVPLCLAFKLEKLYYFTLFINVLGALLAMLLPNVSLVLADGTPEGWLVSHHVNFWLNHYCAFFMPILMMSLRIFKRPKMKQFIYSLIAFAVYFAVVLFANAYLTAMDPNNPVDFFYINGDFISSKLDFLKAEELRKNYVWEIALKGGQVMTLYPLFQSLYFLVYVVMSFAVWFVYEQFFEITDLYASMVERHKKIKADRLALEIQLNGRSINEPMNLEGTNKLILRNFSKRYSTSDVFAVKDANLEIEGGQIFGFLGPNGAGKSTIIKSIVGIQTITSGSIEVCGYDVEKQSVGAKMQIGFVPDHYALYENLTGREYVNYIADLYGVSVEDRTARINEYVDRFNLKVAIDNQIKTYSHGMKQKITIMSALVHNPKVWILDEPLTGLDPESIFQVKECMKNHAEKGNIVFFSSHIIDVVERICDKIAIIKKGEIQCVRTIKDIEECGEKLEDFYLATIGDLRHD